jgi:hypothetical protein
MSGSPTLAYIPSLLDLALHKYNAGHVMLTLPAAADVKCHANTYLPSRISGLGELDAGTLVYKQEWHCCGEYSCSSGNGMKSGRRKCSAVALLTIESTGVEDEFRVSFEEPATDEHGDEYVPPPANAAPRTLYRTKVAMAEAAANGLSYNEMLNSLAEELRPVGQKASNSFRRRYENQTSKPKKRAAATKATKKRTKVSAAQNGTESSDDDEAAALLTNMGERANDFDLAALLLAQREAVPWQEMRSVDEVIAKLDLLQGIDEQLRPRRRRSRGRE